MQQREKRLTSDYMNGCRRKFPEPKRRGNEETFLCFPLVSILLFQFRPCGIEPGISTLPVETGC
jgi:hypothetical protein